MPANSTADATFEKVQQEHEALRAEVGQIHRVLGGQVVAPERIAAMLQQLHNDLVTHFEHEEHDGFFSEISAHAPRLSTQADDLCLEHEQMIRASNDMIRFAARGAASLAWWRELRSRFHEFSMRLMRHESQENALLQRAYQEDIGAHD